MKRRPKSKRRFNRLVELPRKIRKFKEKHFPKFAEPDLTFQGEPRGTKAAALAAIEEAKRRG